MVTRCFLCHMAHCYDIPLFRVSHTDLWPISWATVKATGSPESSLMLQLRCGWHIPDRWDRPRVSQGWFIPAQMSFLGRKHKHIMYMPYFHHRRASHQSTSSIEIAADLQVHVCLCDTCLVTNTATSWWAGCVSLWGLRFFCQAQKLDKVVSAWWTIFNPFCNKQQN